MVKNHKCPYSPISKGKHIHWIWTVILYGGFLKRPCQKIIHLSRFFHIYIYIIYIYIYIIYIYILFIYIYILFIYIYTYHMVWIYAYIYVYHMVWICIYICISHGMNIYIYMIYHYVLIGVWMYMAYQWAYNRICRHMMGKQWVMGIGDSPPQAWGIYPGDWSRSSLIVKV